MIKTTVIWIWLCSCGYVVDMDKSFKGEKLYTFYMPEGKTVRYAYKSEIKNYIRNKNWTFFERTIISKNNYKP